MLTRCCAACRPLLLLLVVVLLQGCGVVEFETPEQAQNAIQLFHNSSVSDRHPTAGGEGGWRLGVGLAIGEGAQALTVGCCVVGLSVVSHPSPLTIHSMPAQ